LLRAGLRAFRRSRSGEPRGLYCAIGVCNECLVMLEDAINVRACVTPARPGARIRLGQVDG
jgi:hypothetical protein